MRLVVKQNDHLVNHMQLIKGPIYLGRHAQCQIFLPSPSVSRQHAVIFLTEEGQWMVKDLHSANKTYLNGKVISEAAIGTGDRIQVGDYIVEVDLEKESAANKQVSLEDTHAPVSPGPQLIKRTLGEKHAPAIRMPAYRANDLHQILGKVARANGSFETLEVLLEVLIDQFHASRVWCSFRYDTEGIFNEEGGRTDTGEFFELQGEAARKLIEQACDNQQFLLFSRDMQEAERMQVQSAIITPIVTDEETLGVIYLTSKLNQAPFTLSDLDYAMLLSINLGMILKNLLWTSTDSS
jgi:hypothetical protein